MRSAAAVSRVERRRPGLAREGEGGEPAELGVDRPVTPVQTFVLQVGKLEAAHHQLRRLMISCRSLRVFSGPTGLWVVVVRLSAGRTCKK